jgi:CheY-like chemotaxis protein
MEKREILVVDDDILTLKIVETILKNEGYSIIPIAYGRKAIEIAKERCPALIILDIMMPDMDGGEVADILKNDPITKDIPIVFLSALIKEKEEKSSSRKDGIFLLSKPFEREKLIKVVKVALRISPPKSSLPVIDLKNISL